MPVSPKLLLCGEDMAPWGQGILSQASGVVGQGLGNLLCHLCEWRLICFPHRMILLQKWNRVSVPRLDVNKLFSSLQTIKYP